ncbi:MAG: tRNA (guanosine(37)-N1)-methyltransferase TrmD [Gammaproteobacteria bacterium]|nr:tRNA (guanosine(37)-N1)-methyltransferase TrmD [Gammaproteobacteria bacterium]
MELHVISIFPDMFKAVTEHGVVGRAIKQDVLRLELHNLRDFADNNYSSVDDRPYGGGPGMVMMPEPLTKAIAAAKAAASGQPKVVYLSPQGQRFNHAVAAEFAARESVILLAGRYEGVDERVLECEVDEEWSIGDYVLSGGELPAMVMIDAIARLLPDSLGNRDSAQQDSFYTGLLDCPHYTRPEQFGGMAVPKVLLSGDHRAIERWRMKQALGRTWLRRPEMLNKIELTDEQEDLLAEFKTDLLDGTSSS